MIVVTGASGMIGRGLMARLESERMPSIGLSRQAFDLSGSASLSSFIRQRPSAVVHLAAAVPQPPGRPDDSESAARTRRIDRLVLDAVQEWRCPVVYASGCSLYDKRATSVRREDDAAYAPPQRSPYLAAKLDGEREFLAYENSTVLRISAPLGEGLPSSAVAMRFFLSARTGQDIAVWGSGSREQNYVDTTDIADAFLRALIVRPRALINISADEPISMLDLAREIVRVCGSGSVSRTGHPDPNEGDGARYSNARASELLGWRPCVPLRESLKRIARSAS